MSCLSQTPPLGGLSPPQGVFQGHAAHLAEWSAKLRPKGSWGTCIPQGVITFFHTAFTAHSDVGAEAGGRQVQALVRLSLCLRNPLTLGELKSFCYVPSWLPVPPS